MSFSKSLEGQPPASFERLDQCLECMVLIDPMLTPVWEVIWQIEWPESRRERTLAVVAGEMGFIVVVEFNFYYLFIFICSIMSHDARVRACDATTTCD